MEAFFSEMAPAQTVILFESTNRAGIGLSGLAGSLFFVTVRLSVELAGLGLAVR